MSDSSAQTSDSSDNTQSEEVAAGSTSSSSSASDPSDTKDKKKNPATTTDVVVGAIALLIFVPLVCWGVYSRIAYFTSTNELDVIASAGTVTLDASGSGIASAAKGLKVVGRVLLDGEPAADVKVWTILRDESGNRASPPAVKTNAAGEFQCDPFALPDGQDFVGVEVRTYALKESGSWFRSDKNGECVVSLGGPPSGRFIRRLAFPMVFVSVVLATTLLLAFMTRWARPRYYGLIITSILMPVAVIWTIASFQEKIMQGLQNQEVLDLGFAKVFEGRYVKDVAPSVVLSLTPAPRTSAATGANAAPAEPELTSGFGAPIWVVLVAVVGSALMTVSLVVREIKSPVRFPSEEPGDFQERINALVQHQLFVVFAPLGGIFVYQGLVVGQAANEPVTVAIAALGAGATLNALLGLAVQKAEAVLTKVTST